MKGPASSLLRTFSDERAYQLEIHRLEGELAELRSRLHRSTDDSLTVNQANAILNRRLQVTIGALREFIANPVCTCAMENGKPVVCVPHRSLEVLADIGEATCRRGDGCEGCEECLEKPLRLVSGGLRRAD